MTEEAGLRATSVKTDITLSVWVGCSANLTARRGRGPLLGGQQSEAKRAKEESDK